MLNNPVKGQGSMWKHSANHQDENLCKAFLKLIFFCRIVKGFVLGGRGWSWGEHCLFSVKSVDNNLGWPQLFPNFKWYIYMPFNNLYYVGFVLKIFRSFLNWTGLLVWWLFLHPNENFWNMLRLNEQLPLFIGLDYWLAHLNPFEYPCSISSLNT